MEHNEKVVHICGFCHGEVKHGMRVCTHCFATVGYGIVPAWALTLMLIAAFGLAALVGFAAHNPVVFIVCMFVFALTGTLVLKGVFKSRVVFVRRL